MLGEPDHNRGLPGTLALTAVSATGVIAFLLPFLVSAAGSASPNPPARTIDASLLLAVMVAGSLLLTAGELARDSHTGGLARSLALLAVLAAIDATLRLLPSFLGASPIFALIILVGFVHGPRFGFIMGAMTLFLSAAITAGVGPWLPFQMLCAGWMGMAAGWVPQMPSLQPRLMLLTCFGIIAGFAYGALMNLYSWPYAAPGTLSDVGLYWNPGLSLQESLSRYAGFYLATSLVHDASRAAANAALILVVGPPILRLLQRLRVRTAWSAASFAANAPVRQ